MYDIHTMYLEDHTTHYCFQMHLSTTILLQQ